jgi:hypothetical protein
VAVAVRRPCPRCYDTGVYYEPIGPDGEMLRAMVCPFHESTNNKRDEEVVPDAR